MSVHCQQGIKMQCKQICLFPEVFACRNKFYIVSMVTSLIFSLALQIKLFLTLRFVTAYYECKR